jgi:AcrR family transcriptional regulator
VPTRSYHAPNRIAAAQRTRSAILASAKLSFEEIGWARTTIPAIANGAGVSVKTVEAHFGTKAKILAGVVSELARTRREVEALDGESELAVETLRHFEQATSAITALPYHADYAVPRVSRSARIARAIDEAAPTDPAVADLAERLRRNHDYGANWAARVVMGKRGIASGITLEEATRVFRFAIDPATYLTLTREIGLDDDGFREWLLRYTRGMLLLRT